MGQGGISLYATGFGPMLTRLAYAMYVWPCPIVNSTSGGVMRRVPTERWLCCYREFTEAPWCSCAMLPVWDELTALGAFRTLLLPPVLLFEAIFMFTRRI